ncbi:MAG: hypothetical protein IIT46_13135, partial [Lachnospiraceae bacterium]|nr:hypothetical protein [Lachnospiraceae bacterium]
MSGWYVINSSVSIENRLTVYGTANLILCDGVKLYLYNGINVSYGNTLNIYCQSGGSGELYCDADINDNVTLNLTNGTFKRVFGGNNVSGTIRGAITVNVEETGCRPVIIGELYGGGNQAG